MTEYYDKCFQFVSHALNRDSYGHISRVASQRRANRSFGETYRVYLQCRGIRIVRYQPDYNFACGSIWV
jgi:hypothetical protein